MFLPSLRSFAAYRFGGLINDDSRLSQNYCQYDSDFFIYLLKDDLRHGFRLERKTLAGLNGSPF